MPRSSPADGLAVAGRGAAGPVRWMFTTRNGGTSSGPYRSLNLGEHVGDDPDRVAANRATVAQVLGADHLAVTVACHGTRVEAVSGRALPPGQFDGLVTATPGVAVMTLAADCLPVLLYDADSGIVGAVHSGWKGLKVDAIGAGLEAMRSLGARTMTAVIGPTICGSCYGVDEQRYRSVVAVTPSAAAVARTGGPALDLRAGASARLRAAGVTVEHVDVCTFEAPDLFSFRRDGVTGRHGGAIVVVSDEDERWNRGGGQ